jgi:hypothetical protein
VAAETAHEHTKLKRGIIDLDAKWSAVIVVSEYDSRHLCIVRINSNFARTPNSLEGRAHLRRKFYVPSRPTFLTKNFFRFPKTKISHRRKSQTQKTPSPQTAFPRPSKN